MPSDKSGTLTGQKLGTYQLLEKLGEGGMGAVYKARDLSLDRTVAVKVLPAALAADKVYVQRFVREARAIAKLSHHNLVHIYHVGTREGLYYFAMEYVPGPTLRQHLAAAGPLTVEEFLRIVGQVLAALGRIHAVGVTHRDVKSSNVIIEAGTGRAVLTDFGLAKDSAAGGAEGLTSAGVVLGTPEYMSPEQADGRSADPRSDVYSFGIMAWEMLVGRVPYSGPSAIAVLRKHLDEPVPSLSAARPGLPADLEAVVARALAKSPEDRYASVAELAADLVRVGHTPELAELAAAGLPATARTIVGAPLSRAASPVAATAPTVLTGGPGAASAGPDHTVRNAVLIVAGAVVLAGIIIGAAVGSRRPTKPPDQNVQVPPPPPLPPEPGRLCRLLPRGGGPPILARVLEVEGCLARVQVELPGGSKVVRQVDLSRFGGIELVPDAPQPPKRSGPPGGK